MEKIGSVVARLPNSQILNMIGRPFEDSFLERLEENKSVGTYV